MPDTSAPDALGTATAGARARASDRHRRPEPDRSPRPQVPERITIEEFKRLREEGAPHPGGGRADRAELSRRPATRGGRAPAAAGRRRAPRPRTTTRPERHARPLLCLKGRSDKHPGGARASSGRMEEGAGAGGWMGGVAGGGAAGGGEVGGGRSGTEADGARANTGMSSRGSEATEGSSPRVSNPG